MSIFLSNLFIRHLLSSIVLNCRLFDFRMFLFGAVLCSIYFWKCCWNLKRNDRATSSLRGGALCMVNINSLREALFTFIFQLRDES